MLETAKRIYENLIDQDFGDYADTFEADVTYIAATLEKFSGNEEATAEALKELLF